MKTSITIILGAAATAVIAADITYPDGFPQCGEMCINNMVAGGNPQVPGCAADDLACLCSKNEFAYGVRDCTFQACGADAASNSVVVFDKAVEVCMSVGIDIAASLNSSPTEAATGTDTDTTGPTATDSDDSDSSSEATTFTTIIVTTDENGDETTLTTVIAGVPISTTIVTTDENDSEVTMTTELTGVPVSTSAVTVTGADGQETVSSSTIFSTVEPTSTTTGSPNYAPFMTAAPGFAAAAGLAALLL